jgi:uncharacterized repeat protein (TIGR01451 family)
MAGPAAAAGPNFSTSTASHEPAKVVAGDVVRYTVTVANSGDTGYARVTTTLPNGYFIRADGDCSTAPPDDDDRRLVWHEGAFASGATKRCRIDLLTRRDAPGTRASLTTEISIPPSGYHSFEATPEFATPPDPNIIRVGRAGLTRAGLVVFAVLGATLAGTAIIVVATRRSGGDRTIALGAWFAVCISAGFLLIFVGLAYTDLRSYRDYREASCFIFDSTIRTLQSSRKSGRTYAPEFAVRYTALGTETYASAAPPASAVSFGWIGHSQRQLDRFAIGSVQPCWYDPDDAKTVLLTRGPGAAYLFALLPLAGLIVFTWVLRGALPSNRLKSDETRRA